jgi:hypothetical protein
LERLLVLEIISCATKRGSRDGNEEEEAEEVVKEVK